MNGSEDFHKHHILQTHHGLEIPADMDYSNYYTPAPMSQQYHFMGLSPTPVHTQPLGNGEFSDKSPPDAGFDFQFDSYNTFNPNPAQPQPPTPQSQNSHQGTSIPSIGNGNGNGIEGFEALDNAADLRGSNSDGDEEAAPALSKRKAQNRAAQRAFRERKERHVKELEAQVAALKQTSSSAASENEALKLHLQKLATENEILKATSQYPPHSRSPPALPDTGPMVYNPSDFYSEVLQKHDIKTPSHRVVTAEDGGRLLAAGATWDYIIAHPLFKKGLVDVGAVSERLKSKAKCDGQGPVFEERSIEEAINNSIASGSDELM